MPGEIWKLQAGGGSGNLGEGRGGAKRLIQRQAEVTMSIYFSPHITLITMASTQRVRAALPAMW